MKRISARATVMATALATMAVLWGGVAVAKDFKDNIQQAYMAAGYSNITVRHQDDRWIVTGDLNGVAKSFVVDRKTGISTPFDLVSMGNHRKQDDGAASGDTHGTGASDDGPGHDVGDDHGSKEAKDDHGGDAHDGGAKDHGGSGDHASGHD